MRALHITGHSEICNKSPPSFADPNATSPYRAERGKGRLWEAPANPYCFTNFECKADLSQPFKGNCSQIRSSVTGGAYNSVCRVTMCVRRDLSIGACLNCTRSTHQTVTKRPFSPHSFPARRKRMGRRRHDRLPEKAGPKNPPVLIFSSTYSASAVPAWDTAPDGQAACRCTERPWPAARRTQNCPPGRTGRDRGQCC